MLVVGKKEVSEGSGITARRVARNAACNILFLPVNSFQEVEHLIVPIDFSSNSLQALHTAPGYQKQAESYKYSWLVYR